MKKIKVGFIFDSIYLAVIIYAYSHGLYKVMDVLTSPWSRVLEFIADSNQFHTGSFIYVNIIISATINAVILYLIGMLFDRRND